MKVIKYRFSLWLNSDTQVAVNKELIINRKKNVQKIKAKKVFLWTVNDKTDLHAIKQLAGYNVITDCVERAKRELTS
jgi:glycerophosphoryl diester phosphodiesterase